jgi:hypothetical protein
MPEVKQNASARVFVKLVDVADRYTPITGKSGADATVTFAKGDGTTANYAGTATLTELTANAWSGAGVYQLTLPSAVTDVLGQLGGVVSVSGAEKFLLEPIDIVANTAADNYARLGAPAGASLAADIATLNTSAGAGLGSAVTAIKAKTDNLPSDPADASDVAAAITSATSALATAAALTTVGTNVTAIKAKTDNLPSDPADESLLEAAITAATSPLATAAATLVKAAMNRRKLHSAGGDANREVLYDDDGTTALHKWDLKDENGDPTVGPNILDKVPVP